MAPTIHAWLAFTAAVVTIGSSTVRFACGTKRSTRASADCPIAKRGSNAATPPATPARRTDRRFMMCPLLIDCLEHVGFRNLLQGGTGRLPCPAYRHRASRRCSFAPARSGQEHEDQFPVPGARDERPLWVQKGDHHRNAPQRARRAERGPWIRACSSRAAMCLARWYEMPGARPEKYEISCGRRAIVATNGSSLRPAGGHRVWSAPGGAGSPRVDWRRAVDKGLPPH